jgi:D-arabinose 1-dehydrogenase-like Zn-dependent alcohol dehydrogenase
MKDRKRLVDSLVRKLEKVLTRYVVFAKVYTYFYKKMTLEEFSMVNLPDGGRVVNIGCGSIPHTLLILAMAKNWDFLGIDRDIHAVKLAKKMVKYYNLSHKIDIAFAEGEDFDVSGFDLVIISRGVEPRRKILERIGESMDSKGMIVYRTTWESLNKIYGKDSIPKNLKIKDVHYRIDGIKTLLLVKN